jgi:hypothetical protein
LKVKHNRAFRAGGAQKLDFQNFNKRCYRYFTRFSSYVKLIHASVRMRALFRQGYPVSFPCTSTMLHHLHRRTWYHRCYFSSLFAGPDS